MNEEEVKNKKVLKYLRLLGLQDSELSYEDSFVLRLGTNRVTINTGNISSRSIRARSDILIKRGKRNLLILEIKSAKSALSGADSDQAISYARLVHPIAPYAVVTNGEKYRIYDTITKKELSSADINLHGDFHVTLPDKDREEALAFFLGYSLENLMLFCRAQTDQWLKPLTGSANDLSKKFIPELTTPRESFVDHLTAFEEAEAPGFLLLGESGDGKTSALCQYVTQRISDGRPTLFFSGLALGDGLLGKIAEEFGWVFSEELPPVQLIRRLSSLVSGTPLVIVIDAVDEWSYLQKAQALLALLRGCRNLSVKVVFSCRIGAWEKIHAPMGSDMGFRDYLYASPESKDGVASFRLPLFSDREFNLTIASYRKVFGVKGGFEDGVLDEARRNPFMLRVMYVVAAECGRRHITFSSLDFFERYWTIVLKRTGDPEIAETQLLCAAELMFRANVDQVADGALRKALNLSGNETLAPALLTQNLLIKSNGQYRFYFQRLRDYLIAYKVENWPQAEINTLREIERTGVRLDALSFYLRHAPETQLCELLQPMWQNMQRYLSEYDKIAGGYFPALMDLLVPGREGELGLVAEYVVQKNMVGGYGFCRRRRNETSIAIVPVDNIFSHSNLAYVSGASSLHFSGSANGFVRINVTQEIVENEVISNVKKLIEKRLLSTRGCQKIADEILVQEVYRNRGFFSRFIDSARSIVKFPISVAEVRFLILREKLYLHYEQELIEDKIRNERPRDGRSKAKRGHVITDEERARIIAKLETTIASGQLPELRAISINMRDLEAMLTRTGLFLEDDRHIDCPWSTDYGMSLANLAGHYPAIAERIDVSRRLVTEYLVKFYREYLDCYKQIVDQNFGPIKHAFPLRAKMPVRLYFEYQQKIPERHSDIEGRIVIGMESISGSGENEVVACEPGSLVQDFRNGTFYEKRLICSQCSTELYMHDKLYWLGNTPLTDAIYANIMREWPHVANELRKLVGVPVKSHW